MKKKFIRPEEKIVRDMITEEIKKALEEFNKKVIGSIKAELNESLADIYSTCEKERHFGRVDKGWIEGLEYAIGVIDRKVAVNSLKEKDE